MIALTAMKEDPIQAVCAMHQMICPVICHVIYHVICHVIHHVICRVILDHIANIDGTPAISQPVSKSMQPSLRAMQPSLRAMQPFPCAM